MMYISILSISPGSEGLALVHPGDVRISVDYRWNIGMMEKWNGDNGNRMMVLFHETQSSIIPVFHLSKDLGYAWPIFSDLPEGPGFQY